MNLAKFASTRGLLQKIYSSLGACSWVAFGAECQTVSSPEPQVEPRATSIPLIDKLASLLLRKFQLAGN